MLTTTQEKRWKICNTSYTPDEAYSRWIKVSGRNETRQTFNKRVKEIRRKLYWAE